MRTSSENRVDLCESYKWSCNERPCQILAGGLQHPMTPVHPHYWSLQPPIHPPPQSRPPWCPCTARCPWSAIPAVCPKFRRSRRCCGGTLGASYNCSTPCRQKFAEEQSPFFSPRLPSMKCSTSRIHSSTTPPTSTPDEHVACRGPALVARRDPGESGQIVEELSVSASNSSRRRRRLVWIRSSAELEEERQAYLEVGILPIHGVFETCGNGVFETSTIVVPGRIFFALFLSSQHETLPCAVVLGGFAGLAHKIRKSEELCERTETAYNSRTPQTWSTSLRSAARRPTPAPRPPPRRRQRKLPPLCTTWWSSRLPPRFKRRSCTTLTTPTTPTIHPQSGARTGRAEIISTSIGRTTWAARTRNGRPTSTPVQLLPRFSTSQCGDKKPLVGRSVLVVVCLDCPPPPLWELCIGGGGLDCPPPPLWECIGGGGGSRL